MSAPVLAEAPGRAFIPSGRTLRPTGARRPFGSSDGGRLTLERMLDGVWEGLRAGGTVECPMCGGRMAGFAPGHEAVGCAECGTSLR